MIISTSVELFAQHFLLHVLAKADFFQASYLLAGHILHHVNIGLKVKQCVHQIPSIMMEATIQPITRTVLRVRLSITSDFKWSDQVKIYKRRSSEEVQEVFGSFSSTELNRDNRIFFKKKYPNYSYLSQAFRWTLNLNQITHKF